MRVLLVEPDPLLSQTLTGYLESLEHVVTRYKPIDMVERASELHVQYVLLAHSMFNHEEIIKEISRLRNKGKFRIIVMSTSFKGDKSVLSLDADRVIFKPFAPEELEASLR